MANSNDSSHELDVLVIGAGFGGCYLLHLLRQNGYKTKVVDAASTLGGVWSWNRYPGARVDCEFPYYGFSDPKIWSTFKWTERFPCDSQLRRYFEHVADVWDLKKDVELETRVVSCEYHDGAHGSGSHWIVKTSKGGQYKCKSLVAATGTSFKQHIPEWKGLESFEGELHHSSLWPQEKVKLAGKRVAVIGAGSTGVQFLQEASKTAASVTQFIRTPNIALPMRQRQITEDEIYAHKAFMPHVFKSLRQSRTGQAFGGPMLKTLDVDEKERHAMWDENWKQGGFHWIVGGFMDTLVSKEANKLAYEYWVSKTAPRIKDPKKRALLVPDEAPYYLGTKRPSLEQDYYECCDLPHVEITNSPIVEFTKTGIVTEEDGERAFDVVAVCTGYDAVTGGLRTMNVQGRGGVDLDTKWQNGVSTHLGMLVKDFPNFFMVYGPQAPTSFTNGPPFIELQAEWIVDVLNKQRVEKIDTLEPKQSEEDAWREGVAQIASHTLAVHTSSWYMGANVPGKKREFLLYLGGIPAWHKACEEALEGWKGFDVDVIGRKQVVEGAQL